MQMLQIILVKYLVVNEVQLEGKKRMDSGSFLRGNQLEAGVMLGE